MKIMAKQQTPIRKMSKLFNKLFQYNLMLNELILKKNVYNEYFDILHIFFDSEKNKGDGIIYLQLDDKILQVEYPFDWDEFSKLDFDSQKVKYLNYINKVTTIVFEKYNINTKKLNLVFIELNSKIQL